MPDQAPGGSRPRICLARGSEGLESPAHGSINAEIIERMVGINAVSAGTRGLVTVSPEQIQTWVPDIILTVDRDFAAAVGEMPEWHRIPASPQ
ncbi:TroA family protein [Pseudogemmobacter bohemicus]|uniref:hypothetical protein n=1 Tax=Pseudogemmobacter bohemicus TaxID=2250708 RepID=UPI0018E4E916|nr:hypothetical protein [Pseudogemmobacter bohemicus]